MLERLLPQPRVARLTGQPVVLQSPLRIFVPEAYRDEVSIFAIDLKYGHGWYVEKCRSTDEADLIITHDADIAPEGFHLRIDGQIALSASTPAGVAYGLLALRQLSPVEAWPTGPALESWTIDGAIIEDEPTFGWRGCHLDVSRHFFDVGTVCRFIDDIALHRINRLHLHLNDDQGWRVEVPEWPLLTTIGAYRQGSPIGHENDNVQDSIPHGGFFTAGDLERIRRAAERRHITIVPEIDLPGHAQAVLAAYPELGNTNEHFDVWNHWGISEHVLNVNEEALRFAEEVVRSVASHFPGSPVHIGGDECPSTEWANSPAARAVMREHGFTDPQQLQGLYTARLSKVLREDGHEVLAWDEVLDAEVPPGTTIVAWRSEEKGIEAARRGYDTIMAPENVFYFDVLSDSTPGEPVAISPLPRVTTWRNVYQHAIIPSQMTTSEARHVRGAQVQLWTEYIATTEHLYYMAFPRLCAFAEVVWGTAGDVDKFAERLAIHVERLAARSVPFRPLS